MATQLRTIYTPQERFSAAVAAITATYPMPVAHNIQLRNKPYTRWEIFSDKPVVIALSKPQSLQRNTAKSIAAANVHKVICASDLDLQGTLVLDTAAVDNTKTGSYNVTVTLTDDANASATINVAILVVDTLAPVITATNASITYGEIASWDNDTMIAVDNVADDVTADVVITYFEADGITPIADLAAFRAYLDNSAAGGVSGVVKYNLTDEFGNHAVEKTITVTAAANAG